MMHTDSHIESEQLLVKNILSAVNDPEIPVLSIADLGILRRVEIVVPKKSVTIIITPTYSGCPAINTISINIKLALHAHGYEEVAVVQELSPAWTTDWLTEQGKRKLQQYGIAPPGSHRDGLQLFAKEQQVICPQCGSSQSVMLSEFGSTSCKALYQCSTCKEPFEYFKCH